MKAKTYPCGGTYIYIDVPSEEALPPALGTRRGPCSCGSFTHTGSSVSCIRMLHLSSMRYFRVGGKVGGDANVFPCLNPSLVGHPCSITRKRFASGPETHRTMDAKELFIICKGWCRRGTGQVKYISWQ